MSSRLYFDYAAATPLDDAAVKAIDSHRSLYANPSAKYSSAREAKKKLEYFRKQIAVSLNCNKDEIVFTSSATESNNLAIFGVAKNFDQGRIISIGTEHPSVYEPLMQLKKDGFTIDWCSIDKYGRIDLENLRSLIKPDTVLITIQYASSTIGTIQPVSKISQMIEDIKQQGLAHPTLHIDATGAQSSIHLSVDRLGVELMTISSTKIYGPSCALLYVRRGTDLKPLMYGGKQELGLRAGTQDLPAIAGFAAAIEALESRRKQDVVHYQNLYNYFIQKLSEKLDFSVFGHPRDRIYNVANIAFDNINGEDLVAYLDTLDIEVATGAACLAAGEKPTRILLALGVEESLAQGSLRISFGRSTDTKEIDMLVEALHSSVNKLRQ